MIWRKFNGDHLEEPIQEAVEAAIIRESEMGNRLKVCIGTDSQVKGNIIEFATVIVFIREKRGGFMFINNDRKHNKMTIKERMLHEVAKSIDIAYALCDLLDRYDVD